MRRSMPTLYAPAKINLTLEILARRSDGYHTLRSVMLPIGLYDRIELRASGRASLEVSDPALARGNLVERALTAAGVRTPYAVTLHKAIPVGGGLGGGSSDAAAVIRAATGGALGSLDDQDWLAVARGLGSDVPFFLAGTGALVEGTGERVTPIGALPEWWTIVARPNAVVPTADAYRLLDARRAKEGEQSSRPRSTSASLTAVDAIQRREFGTLTGTLVNDFHDVVLDAYPEVARADAALRAAGAQHVLLSGSGSCLFALFETEAAAHAIAATLDAAAFDCTFVVPFHHDPAWR
jgi:4-diphosphocytidyl-2-C-methyl-D-erythritol kinase